MIIFAKYSHCATFFKVHGIKELTSHKCGLGMNLRPRLALDSTELSLGFVLVLVLVGGFFSCSPCFPPKTTP